MEGIKDAVRQVKKWSIEKYGLHIIAKPIIADLMLKDLPELVDSLADYYKGTYTNSDSGNELLIEKMRRIEKAFVGCFTLLTAAATRLPLSVENMVFDLGKKLYPEEVEELDGFMKERAERVGEMLKPESETLDEAVEALEETSAGIKDLSFEQLESVVAWMDGWEQLKDTAIPTRFIEDWKKGQE